jgi:hypothetical protein
MRLMPAKYMRAYGKGSSNTGCLSMELVVAVPSLCRPAYDILLMALSSGGTSSPEDDTMRLSTNARGSTVRFRGNRGPGTIGSRQLSGSSSTRSRFISSMDDQVANTGWRRRKPPSLVIRSEEPAAHIERFKRYPPTSVSACAPSSVRCPLPRCRRPYGGSLHVRRWAGRTPYPDSRGRATQPIT